MWNYISVCWTFTIKQSYFSQYKLLILTITLAAAGQAPGSLTCITCAVQICFFGYGTRLLPDTQRPASERARFAKKFGSLTSSCHMSQPQRKCCITSLNS